MALTNSKVDVWNRALARIGESDKIETETDDRLAAEQCALHFSDCVKEVLESSPWPFATKQSSLSRPNGTTTATGDGSSTEYAVSFIFRSNDEVTVTIDGVATTDFSASGAGTAGGAVTFDAAPANAAVIVITAPLAVVGWEYAYDLPGNCVYPTALLDEDQRISLSNPDERIPFEIMLNVAGNGYLICCDVAPDEFTVLEYNYWDDENEVPLISIWPRKFLDAVAWRLAAELALSIKREQKLSLWCLQMFMAAAAQARANQWNQKHPDPEPDPPSVAARS